jgi:Putative adhesin
MDHTFDTPEPVDLYVELSSGTLVTQAAATDSTHVEISGPRAEEFDVRQDGRGISVIAPRSRLGFGGRDEHVVRVTLPTGSDLATRLGSADTEATGSYGTVKIKSGSGEVSLESADGPVIVESGSGDVTCEEVRGDLRIKSGSGDVELGEVHGTAGISTGSGDVRIGHPGGRAVLKTGSGDLRVRRLETDIALTTASGDLVIDQASSGAITAKSASGDVMVGIPQGTPVWTDLNTVTGTISSRLQSGVGQPADGQDHVELRATTVSGDILLRQA